MTTVKVTNFSKFLIFRYFFQSYFIIIKEMQGTSTKFSNGFHTPFFNTSRVHDMSYNISKLHRGATYQVQVKAELNTIADAGEPRFSDPVTITVGKYILVMIAVGKYIPCHDNCW